MKYSKMLWGLNRDQRAMLAARIADEEGGTAEAIEVVMQNENLSFWYKKKWVQLLRGKIKPLTTEK